MAAVTIAEGPNNNIAGINRKVSAVLTAPANGDTWNTGLSQILSVQITWQSATVAAADAIGYTKSGGTVTFVVVGTARDVCVQVTGK